MNVHCSLDDFNLLKTGSNFGGIHKQCDMFLDIFDPPPPPSWTFY